MYLLIVFLSLIGPCLAGFFGKYLGPVSKYLGPWGSVIISAGSLYLSLIFSLFIWASLKLIFGHIASTWYVGIFCPLIDNFINSTEILDELSEPEDKSLSELEGEDEFSKQKKARNKFLRKLFFIYFIAYFGFFR